MVGSTSDLRILWFYIVVLCKKVVFLSILFSFHRYSISKRNFYISVRSQPNFEVFYKLISQNKRWNCMFFLALLLTHRIIEGEWKILFPKREKGQIFSNLLYKSMSNINCKKKINRTKTYKILTSSHTYERNC